MILKFVNDIIPTTPNILSDSGVTQESLWVAARALTERSDSFDSDTDDFPTKFTTKQIIQTVFGAVVFTVFALIVYRCCGGTCGCCLPRRRSTPRRPMSTVDRSNPQSAPPQWPAMPVAHTNPNGHTIRRTNAADIDAGGRRIGDRNAELDHNGRLDSKDALPAYDLNGAPPRYAEVQPQGQAQRPSYNCNNTGDTNIPR